MVRTVLISVLLLPVLVACGNDNKSTEIQIALVEACKNIRPDGGVNDIYGGEKKFAALARLDANYLTLLDVYSNYVQELNLIIETETGRPKKYPPFPNTIKVFCNP